MKYSKRLIISFLVTILLALGLVACGPNEGAVSDIISVVSPILPPTAVVDVVDPVQPTTVNQDALTLFAQNCAACHGPIGAGTTVAPPLNSAELRARLNDDAIRATITNGRPGTAMPVWANMLSPAQIDILVDLIRYWPELDDAALVKLQEEAGTAVGPNGMGSGMMGMGMMDWGMMNGHMGWQAVVPPVTPYPGQNPAWEHHGMNGNNGSWQGDGCCGRGMIRPGN